MFCSYFSTDHSIAAGKSTSISFANTPATEGGAAGNAGGKGKPIAVDKITLNDNALAVAVMNGLLWFSEHNKAPEK